MWNTVKSIALLSLTGMTLTASAGGLSPEEALSRALRERGGVKAMSKGTASSSMNLVSTISDKSGEAQSYLFVPAGGRGFVLASASDESEVALLGYSDNAQIEADNIPEAMQSWMEGYATTAGSRVKAMPAMADERADIEPILSSTWGQGSPFNDRCPSVSGSHTPCGCVATALGQCMKVMSWPSQGKGTKSYKWSGVTLALNFDTISYDWDQMLDDYSYNGGTAEQRAEVAKLLYSIGVSVRMSYNPAGSGSNLMNAASALVDYFDYAPSVCYHEREYYTTEEWTSMIYDELSAGRPVPYTGSGNVDGHAFVIDGYRQGGYFHMNWGHNGTSDGYFLMNDLDPWLRGSYASGYNQNQTMITGLIPSCEEPAAASSLRCSGDFVTAQSSYSRTSTSSVTFRGNNGIFSMGSTTVKVNMGVKLTDGQGNVSYAASPSTVSCARYSARQTYTVPTSSFPASGTYEVSPAYRTSDGEWHDVKIALSHAGSVKLTATSGKLVFSESGDTADVRVMDIDLRTPIHIGQRWSLAGTFGNSGAEYLDQVWPVLVRNDSIIAHGPGIDLNILNNGVETMEWTGTFSAVGSRSLTPGEYRLGFADSKNSVYTMIDPESTIDVTVQGTSSAEVIASATTPALDGYSGISVKSSPSCLSALDCVPVNFTVSCEQGYMGQDVSIRICSADLSRTYITTPATFVGVDEGESCEVTIEADLHMLWENTVFAVVPYASTSGQLSEEPAYFRIGVTGIESVTADTQAGIFPNPAGESTTLRHSEPVSTVEVFSISGMAVAVDAQIQDNCATLNVAHLQHGIYMVRVNGSTSYRMLKR